MKRAQMTNAREFDKNYHAYVADNNVESDV